jgi:hypothetical protein
MLNPQTRYTSPWTYTHCTADSLTDRSSQGEDRSRKRMGSLHAEAHLLWYGILLALLVTSSDIKAGKILADANTVESYKIEEKGFIVCMVSKVGLTAVNLSSAIDTV